MAIPFAGNSERVEVVYARVRRPDGTVTETPVEDALERSARLELCDWRRETLDKESVWGRGKKYQPEQEVNLLRQIEVNVANGKTTALVCKEAGLVEQTYFRWRKEDGGLQVDQAKRLKGLEQENSKLKRLVAN